MFLGVEPPIRKVKVWVIIIIHQIQLGFNSTGFNDELMPVSGQDSVSDTRTRERERERCGAANGKMEVLRNLLGLVVKTERDGTEQRWNGV